MQDHLKNLSKAGIKRHYPAGATVLYQGEAPRSVQVVTKGAVRVFSISDAGEEQIVTYHTAYDMFPVSWIFGNVVGALFFYEAMTDTEIAHVPKEDFMAYFHASVERMDAVISSLASSYAAFMLRINALEQSKARQKLVYTLYYLSQRYGVRTPTNPELTKISISLTHQNIAALVGLTRETTTTQMNELRREKAVSYSSQTYVVDEERLLDIIGEDSFRGITFAET